MSYNTIYQCATDMALQNRVTACCAQEIVARDLDDANAPSIMTDMIWDIASASDIEAAYASALAAGDNNPGGNEAVITDGMILASVQANWPSETNPLP